MQRRRQAQAVDGETFLHAFAQTCRRLRPVALVPLEKSRARQNVILELGFFLGKLGRKRVCALYQEGVEIPSDYAGVLFVPFDGGGAWRFTLARELKAAELDIDLNLAI